MRDEAALTMPNERLVSTALKAPPVGHMKDRSVRVGVLARARVSVFARRTTHASH